jgi:hypothetical protein
MTRFGHDKKRRFHATNLTKYKNVMKEKEGKKEISIHFISSLYITKQTIRILYTSLMRRK